MPENRLPRSESSQLLITPFSAIFLVLVLLGSIWPQTASSQPQSNPPAQSPNQAATPSQPPGQQTPSQPPNPSGATQVPGAGVAVQNQQQGSAQSPAVERPEPQTRITRAQAKELFRSVDEILDFASHDTGLSMERYVDKRMKDDKDAQRLEQSRLVLEKFGLLPPGYDLHSEFLRLLGEQVAAYYDSKSKSVNLLDWVQPDIQKPVLAHELTHA